MQLSAIISRTLLMCALPMLSACGIYFHSDAVQERTEKARAEFAKVAVATQVEDRLASLRDIERRDDLLLAREMAAKRDLVLLSILRPRQTLSEAQDNSNIHKIDSYQGDECLDRQRTRADVSSRLLVRINCILSNRLPHRLDWAKFSSNAALDSADPSKEIQAARAEMADDYDHIAEDGASEALRDMADRDLERARIEGQRLWIRSLTRYAILRDDLGNLPKNHPYLLAPNCDTARQVDVSDSTIRVGEESFTVDGEIATSWDELGSACRQADEARENLTGDLEFLACGNNPADECIETLASPHDELGRSLDELLKPDSLCGTGANSTLAHIASCVAIADNALTKAREIASNAAAEVKRLTVDSDTSEGSLKDALAKLKDVTSLSQEVAEAAGFARLSEILQDLAMAEAAVVTGEAPDLPDDPARAKRTQIAKSALSLLGAGTELIEQYGEESSSVRLGALIIAKSQAEARRDLANLAVRQLEQKAALREKALKAALTEIRLTAQAGETLMAATPNHAADALGSSLGQLAQAYDTGAATIEQAELEEFQDITRFQVRRSAIAAKAYQDAIAPAIAALEEYGKGGIDGNELAKILAQALGSAFIGGAILGK